MAASQEDLVSRVSHLESELISTQSQLANALQRIENLEKIVTPAPKVKAPPTFRLLDLPSEIRNQIYEFAAISAFEVPASLVYARHLSSNSTQRKKQMCSAHGLRRGAGCRNRLAMLYTNRQVYGKASQIFYRNMSLDLRRDNAGSSHCPTLQLNDIFKHSLQHVRHIELEYDIMIDYLFMDGKAAFGLLYDELEDKRPDMGYIEAAKQRPRFRTYLFALKSITAYSDDLQVKQARRSVYKDWPPFDIETGINLMYNMADTRSRKIASRLFPHLHDITCVSAFGSERFRKDAGGG